MAKNKKPKKSKKPALKLVPKVTAKKKAVKSTKKAAPKKVVVKKVELTEAEVFLKLQKSIPKAVFNTTYRYANGPLATIFNEADMTALAEDTALEVARRVKIGIDDPSHQDSVDLKGADAYFKMAYKNQCLKVYEKYAKTDIRAGIQTLGSDEAMAVAASKNLYSPEDNYVLGNQMDLIVASLDKADRTHNNTVMGYATKSGREVKAEELQHFTEIFKQLIEGYTAEEIESSLGISNSDFLRQKRLLFEFVKASHPLALDDMESHFDSQEDLRIHVRDVNKRQKLKQAVRDFKAKALFYIHATVNKQNEFVAVLYARIEMYDRFNNKSSQVAPKLLKVKEIKGKNVNEEMTEIKNRLWAESKGESVKMMIEDASNSYLEEVKNNVAS